MNIIEGENIVKKYSHHLALDQLSFQVPQGSVYGLLGPNGAGKTTLIRIITQITAPDSGNLFFHQKKMDRSIISKIGYLPEERGLYKKMKVGEQALYLAQIKGLKKDLAMDRLKEWFIKFEIQTWWNKKVEELSKGMQQKIQFISTIIHEPELLIFDEPFSGFDPINTNLLKEEILNQKKKGVTIIFSTHNMESVEELCDQITLIHQSKNILDGSLADLKKRFKKNQFEVIFARPFNRAELAMNTYHEIVSLEEFPDKIKVILKLKESVANNVLINSLMAAGEIINFEESLPSMNDIFIDVVNTAKNAQ